MNLWEIALLEEINFYSLMVYCFEMVSSFKIFDLKGELYIPPTF